MAANVFALSLGLLLVVGSSPALGEIYTWVDERGEVHFSDTPHGGAKRVPAERESSPAARDTHPQTGPIPYRGKQPSLRLAVMEVKLGLPTRGLSRLPVGRKYRGYYCNTGAEDLVVDLSKPLKGSKLLPRDFHRRLAALAYQPPEFVSNGRKKVAIADLLAEPTITELSLRACTGRRLPDRRRLPNKNLVEVTIRWKVIDRLTRKQVFLGTTESRLDRWNQEYGPTETDRGIVTATRHALMAAAEQLLADPEFVAVLSPGGGRGAESALPPAALMDAAPEPRAGRAATFKASLPAVRRATPMIRTTRGSGHGVLISADGQVLTNYRVVAKGSDWLTAPILVVFESESIKGRVVRADQTRGVALIQLERPPTMPPLPVARNGIGISEPVYVVGGPLEEDLAHTVSEGVITAHRVLGGSETPFYQTNAAIDRNNPTGPVLNERGEIVALASAVWANRPPGVHYLIPIDDALKALGVDP